MMLGAPVTSLVSWGGGGGGGGVTAKGLLG